MRICVYGASSNEIDKMYMKSGEEFGRELALRGHGLVFGGGCRGLMGAAARGAFSEKGEIIGVAPEFFNVDGTLYDKCTELLLTKTMRERKEKMEMLSDAFVMLPGGIGTFDEFFEILTLRQLGIHTKPIGILNTNGFYDDLIRMLNRIADENFMMKTCLELFELSEKPAELLSRLEKRAEEKAEPRIYKKIN